MGILSGILGNATEVEIQEIENEVSHLLIEGESVEKAFKLIRDLFIFTNKRLVLIDKQGMTGKKIDYHSIPYTSISHFSVEKAGHFDLDAEMKIYIKGGTSSPFIQQFKKGGPLEQVQKTLATFVLKASAS